MSKFTKPSEGFFIAKRRMQDALIHRIDTLEKERDALGFDPANDQKHDTLQTEINALEKFRDYVRNGLLWDTSEGP